MSLEDPVGPAGSHRLPRSLACPECATVVPYTVELLIEGSTAACPGCGQGIRVQRDSEADVEELLRRVRARLAAGRGGETEGEME